MSETKTCPSCGTTLVNAATMDAAVMTMADSPVAHSSVVCPACHDGTRIPGPNVAHVAPAHAPARRSIPEAFWFIGGGLLACIITFALHGFGPFAAPSPIVFHAEWSRTVTVHGKILFYRDYIAMGGGVVATACGLGALLTTKSVRGKAFGLGLGALVTLLGAYQLAIGFGLL